MKRTYVVMFKVTPEVPKMKPVAAFRLLLHSGRQLIFCLIHCNYKATVSECLIFMEKI